MATTIEKIDIHKFDGNDFYLWKFQMKLYLNGQDLYGVVDGTSAKPAAEDVGFGDWKKKDNRAMMYLTQAMSKRQLS